MQLADLIERFQIFDDWEERYAYLIELGKELPTLADHEMTEETRIRGCVSKVWLVSERDGERHVFRATSDAHIVRGLIAVVLTAFSNKTAAEIAATDIEGAFTELGLDEHLSHNRRNGFFSMVKRIRSVANA